jgi:hypothetical protein
MTVVRIRGSCFEPVAHARTQATSFDPRFHVATNPLPNALQPEESIAALAGMPRQLFRQRIDDSEPQEDDRTVLRANLQKTVGTGRGGLAPAPRARRRRAGL